MSDGESSLSFESDDDGPVLAAPAPRFAGRLEALAEVYSGVSDEVLRDVVERTLFVDECDWLAVATEQLEP